MQKTCCNYLCGLQSDNESIVEATLIYLMKMISRYSDFTASRLRVPLDWLAQHHFQEIDAFVRLLTSMERIVTNERQ